MTMQIRLNETEQALIREFHNSLPALPGDAALRARRIAAIEHFAKVGLPSRRDEDWHYTDYRSMAPVPLMQAFAPLESALTVRSTAAAAAGDAHVGLQQGKFEFRASLPPGVQFYNLDSALKARPDLVARLGEVVRDDDSTIACVNTAAFADALFVVIGKGVKLDKPLSTGFSCSGDFPLRMVGRAFIIVEDGAEVTFYNSVSGVDGIGYQSSAVIEMIIGDDAKVAYIRNNSAGDKALCLHIMGARLGARSELNIFNMSRGGRIARHEFRVAFLGADARASIRGVNILRGEQHSDVTLMVDHTAPGCESRELFRHVVDDSATGVFQGKIMVKQAAQKTDGQMASNAILLSDEATMNNKPELEIFADDVVCAHGATCGTLDEDLLFYLQARGLPKKDAEALMIQAFCGEAIETIENETLRDELNGVIEGWLAARAGA